MKHLIVVTLFFVLLPASTATAKSVLCTISDSGFSRFIERCETFRVRMRIPTDDLGDDRCASEFLRRGRRKYASDVAHSEANRSVDSAVQTELDRFDSENPEDMNRTTCGDGIIQAEFGETCDDSNLQSGDGCDSECKTEI